MNPSTHKPTDMTHEARITTDLTGKKIIVTRAFNAPVEKVWRAFTERAILDQWWAPKPWTIEAVAQEFRGGGFWHFRMSDQEGRKVHWRVDYVDIAPHACITTTGGPCDEKGNLSGGMPAMKRLTEFSATDTGSEVSITILFESEDDLQKMAGSGMLTGTKAVLDNLEILLASSLAN